MSCISHCCLIHGCKYDYTNCAVVNAVEPQEFPCEACHDELGLRTVAEVKAYDLGTVATCPHCGWMLRE